MPTYRTSASERGFSLIELMVVVAVSAILLSIALPNFTDLMTRNRIASQANEFIAAITYARSEAIRQGAVSGICASNNGTSCGGTWSDGWLVWADADRDGAFDAAEVLRVSVINDKDEFTATDVAGTVRFDRRGLVEDSVLNAATPDAEFTLQPRECTAGKPHVRTLTLTLTGQVRLVQGSCA